MLAVFEENEREGKKNRNKLRRPRPRKDTKLMPSDVIQLNDNNKNIIGASTVALSRGRTAIRTTPAAVVNEEPQKIGQMVCQAI